VIEHLSNVDVVADDYEHRRNLFLTRDYLPAKVTHDPGERAALRMAAALDIEGCSGEIDAETDTRSLVTLCVDVVETITQIRQIPMPLQMPRIPGTPSLSPDRGA
jgi:hypothetical protein